VTADIISLADARAAAQKLETLASVRTEFEAHMRRGPGTSSEAHFVQTFAILTRLWAQVPDEPPDGGSRVEGAG
jgi:hypothetical protein